MEKHRTSLELSKQLKEAGWKKETECSWYVSVLGGKPHIIMNQFLKNGFNDKIVSIYPAPLATEILEEFDSWREQGIYIFNDCDTYFVQFREFGFGKLIKDCSDQFLPNALAKMWLYLKKGGLI